MSLGAEALRRRAPRRRPAMVRSTSSSVSSMSFSRREGDVEVLRACPSIIVMKGTWTRVCERSERAHLARSAASLMRCMATRSPWKVGLVSSWNCSSRYSTIGVVEVDAAQEGVAAGGDHLEDVVVELEHRGVEGAAAQVVDEHALVELAAEAVGERRRGGLVEDALDVEPGEPPGLAHRLALVVVVVGGDGDDRARDGLAELVLRPSPSPRAGSARRSAAACRRGRPSRTAASPLSPGAIS